MLTKEKTEREFCKGAKRQSLVEALLGLSAMQEMVTLNEIEDGSRERTKSYLFFLNGKSLAIPDGGAKRSTVKSEPWN